MNETPGNIIIIGRADQSEVYIHSIIKRMNPEFYNQFNCIIIQVSESRLDTAETIIKNLSYAGLIEKERKNVRMHIIKPDGTDYYLDNAWEIRLEKIPELLKYEKWSK